jgi:hypothetical protein
MAVLSPQHHQAGLSVPHTNFDVVMSFTSDDSCVSTGLI